MIADLDAEIEGLEKKIEECNKAYYDAKLELFPQPPATGRRNSQWTILRFSLFCTIFRIHY